MRKINRLDRVLCFIEGKGAFNEAQVFVIEARGTDIEADGFDIVAGELGVERERLVIEAQGGSVDGEGLAFEGAGFAVEACRLVTADEGAGVMAGDVTGKDVGVTARGPVVTAQDAAQ